MNTFQFFKKQLKDWCYISFQSDLILHAGDAIIKRKLIGYLPIFGIQYTTGNSCILLAKLTLCLERCDLSSLIIWYLVLLFVNLYLLL